MDDFYSDKDFNITPEENSGDNADNFGEVSGFDNEEPAFAETDGFYTKSHDDIIQDSAEPEILYSDSKESGFEYGDTEENKTDNYYVYHSPQGKASKKKEKKKKYGAGVIIASVILSALIGFGGAFATFKLTDKAVTVDPDSLPKVSEEKEEPSTEASPKEDILPKNDNSGSSKDINISVNEKASSIAQAVSLKCSKSVVGIRTTTSVISFFGNTSESTGEGSGVIYTADGFIITNYHVIENAVTSTAGSKIEVFLDNANTKPYAASVVGYNISCDLAVLKINANGLSKADIGNSSNLKVGQYAVTIGAPGGLEFMGSVTYGIISGLNRVVSSNSTVGLIQTDAAINPGNSGGALLDENGKLIGINSSKIVSEEFEGMGFAIPVNSVVEICNGIITNKDKSEPYVGITISDKYTSDVLSAYGYPVGAVVLSVADGSEADKCGIQKGDIITEFNGTKITEYNVFGEVLSKCTPDTTVTIKIYRSGKHYQAKIKIGSNS